MIFRENVGKYSIHGAYGVCLCIYDSLVGGIPTPLNNMKVSWADEIPNIWKNKNVPKHQSVIVSKNLTQNHTTSTPLPPTQGSDFPCPSGMMEL